MTDERIRRLRRQLQEARYRLLVLDGDFASPLREMIFVATKNVKRMSTNGACIYFDPDWLQKLGNKELDFMLSHQLMHIACGHIDRPKYYSGDKFHLACDIVANSYLEMLGFQDEKLPHVGNIFCDTFYPVKIGRAISAREAFDCIPFDPSTMSKGRRRTYMIDSEEWWDKQSDRGECGDIVLCPEDEEPKDLVFLYKNTGEKIRIKKELFVEEKSMEVLKGNKDVNESSSSQGWDKSVEYELKLLKCMKKSEETGLNESFDERLWCRTSSVKLDWKKLLNIFIQEEICDYSFTPPDRRFQSGEFFLPDYNVVKETPEEVLFMVDTSGSIDNDTLSYVYTEICEALIQFNGAMIGLIGFFDTKVHNVGRFGSVNELFGIIPQGGGGTSFRCIFDYVQTKLSAHPPISIVIFTDGDGDFPEEAMCGNIPVMWLFTKKGARAPWGRAVNIK